MSNELYNNEQLSPEQQQQLQQDLNATILAMAQNPSDAENYHNLAKLYAMNNSFDKVISVYDSLLSIHPDDSQAL